jgi:hypothetical protein
MFCASRLVFGGTEGVGSRFHVLRSRTHFQRYRGRPFPFSCFAITHSFSAVSRASCPVFMICAPGLVFDGTKGVGSRVHVFRARTRFRHVFRAAITHSVTDTLIFMICGSGLVFDGAESVGYRFYILRAQIHFRRYRVRRVTLSCFACPDSF